MHATLQRRRPPHGLRFGPDPSTHTRCTDRRDDRQQRLRLAGARLRPHRDNVVDLDVAHRPTAAGCTLGRPARGAAARPAATPWSASHLGHDPHRVRPLRPAGVRLRLEHLLPENGCDSPGSWSAARARSAVVAGATVRLVEDARAPALAVLGYPAWPRPPTPCRRCCRTRRSRCEGLDARLVDVVRDGRPRRAGPAARRRLAVRRGHRRRRAERGAGGRRRLVADAGAVDAPGGHRPGRDGRRCGGSARTAPGWPAAPCAARRTPGWEDAAVPPERLGRLPARVRRAAAPSTASTACPTATSATAACTCASTSRSPARRRRPRSAPFVEAAAELVAAHGGSMSGEHGDGRARCELLPPCTPPQALALFAQVKAALRPGQPAQPRRARRPGARSTPTSGCRGPAARAHRLALRLRARRRRPRPPRCTAAPASASAAPTPPPPAA